MPNRRSYTPPTPFLPNIGPASRARDEWCAGEVVGHLIVVERAVISGAARVVQKSPQPVRLWRRGHLPIRLVEARLIHLKTPIPQDPALIGSKEQMLGELRLTRARAVQFLEETQNRDLSAYGWRHVFLGRLNIYEWFEMIAAHQVRHTKQMKEIGRRLPKVVEISQNQ